MGIIYMRHNEALDVNPPAGDQQLSYNGSNWLWAVTAVFALSFLVFVGLSAKPKNNERIFHYLFATALLVGAITYFAQAADLAWHVISQANNTSSMGATRQIFWAKYVFWVVAFPVVQVALGLLSGVSWASIVYNVVLSWIWIVSYLVSAFTTTNYKWGFFAFGTAAWLLLVSGIWTDGRATANRNTVDNHNTVHAKNFTMLSGLFTVLSLLYVIAFGVSDGGNRIGVTPSFIWFGILDLLLIPVMGYLFITLARKWDYNNLNLHFTQHGRVARGDNHYSAKPVVGGHNTAAVV